MDGGGVTPGCSGASLLVVTTHPPGDVVSVASVPHRPTLTSHPSQRVTQVGRAGVCVVSAPLKCPLSLASTEK